MNWFMTDNKSQVYIFRICIILLAGSRTSLQRERYVYESYQGSVTCTASHFPKEPKSLEDIQSIVKFGLRTNKKIKAVGNLHSITDCICTTGIPINMKHINHFSFDPDTNLATVGAGSKLIDLTENLHKHGRALSGAPSYGAITVGGALGTGAHGTSALHHSTLSEQIVSVTIVDGLGNIRTFSEENEDFEAFRVNLGLLGIIYEVVVNTEAQFKLQIRNYPVSDDILWHETDLLDLADRNDLFHFWWFPSSRAVVLSVGNRVPANETGNCGTHLISESPPLFNSALSLGVEVMQTFREHIGMFLLQEYAKLSLYQKVAIRSPIFSDKDTGIFCPAPATGYGHRMITNECRQCAWKEGHPPLYVEESNFSLPKEELLPALKTLRNILVDHPTEFLLNGIYFRFQPSSKAYLATNSGRDAVSVDWVSNRRYDLSQPRLGLPALQAMGQALVDRHSGRPHWGKSGLYYSNSDIFSSSYPKLPEFLKVQDKMDPRGLFMNDFGQRLRSQGNKVSVSSEMSRNCALNEVCLCQTNEDCGNDGWMDYACGTTFGYKVCKEKPNFLFELAATISRQLINSMAQTPLSERMLYETLSRNKEFGGFFSIKKGTLTEFVH